MHNVSRILERIGSLTMVFSVTIIILLSFPIGYDVIARKMGNPTIWVFEVTLYTFIAGTFLANAYALKNGDHFRVTFLSALFPKYKRLLNNISLITTMIFGLIILISGVLFVGYSFIHDVRSSSILNVPLYIPQLALPLGGLSLFIQSLAMLIDRRNLNGDH
jgi:C4-dicarboxylate transporter DctQ subunit